MENTKATRTAGLPLTALIVVGGIISAILCTFCYWLVDRTPPITAVSGRFLGWDEKIPRRGHVLWGAIRVRDDCEGTIYRYIVDGEIARLEPRPWTLNAPIDEGEQIPTTWDAPFDVPAHMNQDAKYRNRFRFVCNFLHKLWPIEVAAPDVPYSLREEDKVMPYRQSEAEPAPQTNRQSE